ncbi:MAG TPA: TonB family protein [Candidatus Acidoferrum sp.]|nr:TonB family protein [Candidatus Acidoferrum sp.]
MNGVIANTEEIRFTPYITASGILHGGLIVLIAVSAYFHWDGNRWAGPGGGSENVTNVKLVGNSGMPLPTPPSLNESNVVDPSKSLWKNDVKPEPPQPKKEEIVPPDLKNVPEFKTLEKNNKKPPPLKKENKAFEPKQPNPDNAVPGRNLGAMKVPTGAGTQPGASSTPGMAIKAEGGGDFASRYGWYIEAVKRRIQTNWLQNTIDPGVLAAHSAHAVVEFTIYKDGTVKDIRISQTSGNQSMDNSGMRAIMSSNPMPGLPPDYSGSTVRVIFDFDLSMTR